MAERTLREPPAEFTDWVRANAIPLAGADPDLGMSDLEPFRRFIGDARVLGLGEATHGTREFFLLKHRLFKFAVRELGFTMFGLEAPYPDCLPINDYVHGNDDEIFAPLALTRIWAWDCEEVLGLVRWMREHNQRPDVTRKVSFWGWDPSWPASSARRILQYLKQTDSKLAREATEQLAPLATDFNLSTYRLMPWAVQNATADAIVGLSKALEGAPPEVRLLVRVLEEGERQLRSLTINEAFAWRSRGAAENMARLLDLGGSDSRMAVWAHNGHFQRAPFVPGVQSMGTNLSRAFREQYVNVGFAFSEGEFRGIDLGKGNIRSFYLPPSPPGTLDAALATVDHPIYAIDFRKAPRSGPMHEWLLSGPPARVMTSTWTEDQDLVDSVWGPLDKPNSLNWADPRDCFDIMIFVRSTTASRPNHPDWPAGFSASLPPLGEIPGPPDKLEFRPGSEGLPEDWTTEAGFGAGVYRVTAANGSLELARDGVPWYWWGDATVSRAFTATPYVGKRVRFSARIEANGVETGPGAQIFVRVDGPPGGMSQNSMPPSAPVPLSFASGANEAEVEVPLAAKSITIGMVLSGNGQAVFWDPSFRVLDR